MLRSLIFLTLAAAALPGCAKDDPASPTVNAAAAVQAGIKAMGADVEVKAVLPTPIPGVVEVRTEHEVLYFSADGRYLIAGDMLEVATQTNLTEGARAVQRAALLATSNSADHVVFKADGGSKRRILVFTDVTCGYCQKLHSEVPALVAAGVTVEYLAWPRGGPRSEGYAVMQSVWCTKEGDRPAAYDKAMAGESLPATRCVDVIRKQYELGEKLSVAGTPAIFDTEGRQLGGYLSAEEIIKALDRTAPQSVAKK